MSIVYLIGILLCGLFLIIFSALFLIFIEKPIIMALCFFVLGIIILVMSFIVSLLNKAINLLPNGLLNWISYGEAHSIVLQCVKLGYIGSGVVICLSFIVPLLAKLVASKVSGVKQNTFRRYYKSKRALRVRKY